MSMTPDEMGKVLTALAALDPRHTINDQNRYAAKVRTWLGVCDDVDYEPTMKALQAYYRDPNAASITAAVLRQKALQATVNTGRLAGTLASPYERNERACRAPACQCTHSECFDGWLDLEETYERHGQTYTRVHRCPTCKDALLMKATN